MELVHITTDYASGTGLIGLWEEVCINAKSYYPEVLQAAAVQDQQGCQNCIFDLHGAPTS